MANNDNNSDVLPQGVLDWLKWVGAIAAALAVILGAIFSGLDLEGDAQLYAYGAALLFAIGSTAVFYDRRQHAGRFEIPESAEPSTCMNTTTPESAALTF